jgi:hypothetical protein
VKEIRKSYLPLNKTPPIPLQWKDIQENTTQQDNQAMSTRMGDDVERPNPGDVWDSDWNIGLSGTQDAESKNHPTPSSEPTLIVPLNQVKLPNRVSNRQKKIPSTKSDDFLW